MTALAIYEGKNLDLMRRTVAKDANDAEFDQFVHICKATRLDPLRRQAYCFVFGKDDPLKRQMVVVTAIAGYRAIAARTGTYRPDNRVPRFTYDDTLIGPANPLGIVSVEVSVFQHSHGEWHEVVAEVYWDDYAPIIQSGAGGFDWQETGQFYPQGHAKAGKPKFRKVPIGDVVATLDPTKPAWQKGRIMLPKCAEAAALRKAWPDDFAGVEIEEEIDRRTIDITPSEMANAAATESRMARLGGAGIMVDWCDGEPLTKVPLGKFVDAVIAFSITHKDDLSRVVMWGERNRVSLQEFWAHDKNGALEIKRVLEGARKMLEAA